MQIHCSTLLSHFECDSHTLHMLTQLHLNLSCYINSGWTFSGQALYVYMYMERERDLKNWLI